VNFSAKVCKNTGLLKFFNPEYLEDKRICHNFAVNFEAQLLLSTYLNYPTPY